MAAVNISTSGLAFIADEEGFVDHVYRDIAGIETIGFGHVMRPGDPTNVTREQAMAILRNDVAGAESAIWHDVKVIITQGQYDALASFAFNLGTGALATSTLLQLLNKGDVQGAAREFLKWCHARVNGVLVRVQGLYNRRVAEATMFLGMSDADARVALGLEPEPAPVAANQVTPVAPEVEPPEVDPGDEDA